jgi:hypothetical protein
MTAAVPHDRGRALRSLAFALAAALLGVLGHASSAGEPVQWIVAFAAVPPLAAYGWLVRERRIGLVQTVATLAGAQVLVHLAATSASPAAATAHTAAHGSHHVALGVAAMLAAHAIATLVAAVVLWRLDVIAWRHVGRMVDLVRRAIRGRRRSVPARGARGVASAASGDVLSVDPHGRWAIRCTGRRGPPRAIREQDPHHIQYARNSRGAHVHTIVSKRAIAALTAAAALALPTAASAHPSVYQFNAKVSRTNEVQTITIDATGGTFKPSANATEVAFDASLAVVQDALEADSAIGVGSVLVTGTPGATYSIQFRGTKSGTDVAQVAPDDANLTGGAGTAVAATAAPGGVDITYAGDPDGSDLPTEVRYLFADHGYPIVLRETNGLTSGGGISYMALPNPFRGTATQQQKWEFALSQTGAQPHATCDTPSLKTPAAIGGWQGTDPFYAYIPFQSTAVGVDDTASDWIPVVLAEAGVDLTGMSAAQAEVACESAPLNGKYYPADTPVGAVGAISNNFTAAQVAAGKAPLESQITMLTSEKTALQGDKTTLQGEKAALETKKSELEKQVADLQQQKTDLEGDVAKLTDVTIELVDPRFRSTEIDALVTGAAGASAKVDVRVSTGVRRALKLTSNTIATRTVTLGATGAELVTPMPGKAVRTALTTRRSVPVTITVTIGSETATVRGTIIR